MTIGERIEARRKQLKIKSQAQLARDAGINQSTLNGLIRNPYRWSPHMVVIARTLRTTVEYLTGVTDDPDGGVPPAPPPPPAPPSIFLRVELPSEEALAAMFESLLDGLNPADPRDEQARQLAQLLPIGLSQLVDARPAPIRKPRRPAAPAARETALATADRGPRS